MEVSKGRAIVIVSTVGTYIELCYIKYFNANKCHYFAGMKYTLWSRLVLLNTLKGFPSVPCGVRMRLAN